jgi:hypothetical protein
VTAVDYHALAIGPVLGQGARGTVFAVYNAKVHQQFDAVYKEYLSDVLPEADFDGLEAMAGLVPGLLEDEGRWLCERTAWPAGLVERDGQNTGYLMRIVPASFRLGQQEDRAEAVTAVSDPAEPSGGVRLATFEYLLDDIASTSDGGPQVSAHDRLLLLADLAVTLDRLHRLGIVVGNLSPRNLLFAQHPAPHCFVISCDSMRLDGRSALPQTEADEWQIPAGEQLATAQSDAYKFGLLAVRLIGRDRRSLDTHALATLDPALGTLAAAAIGPDPAVRPAPGEWVGILNSAAAAIPTLHGATTATGVPHGVAAEPTVPVAHVAPSAPMPAPRGPSIFSGMTTQVPGYSPPRPAPAPEPFAAPSSTPAGASPFGSAAASWDPSAPTVFGGAPAGGYGSSPADPYFTPQPVMHPAHANRRIFGPVVVGVAGLAVITGAVFGINAILSSNSHSNNSPNRAGSQTTFSAGFPSSPSTRPSPTPSALPSSAPPATVGLVRIASGFVTDPRATAVASMFDAYFTGIDQKDYPAALSEYDPAGTVNPNDVQQAQQFQKGVSSSNDTDIVLTGIAPTGQAAPATSAQVTFQSTQSAGMGPPDATGEICTKWQLTYVLSQAANGSYLIYNVSSATDQAC